MIYLITDAVGAYFQLEAASHRRYRGGRLVLKDGDNNDVAIFQNPQTVIIQRNENAA